MQIIRGLDTSSVTAVFVGVKFYGLFLRTGSLEINFRHSAIIPPLDSSIFFEITDKQTTDHNRK